MKDINAYDRVSSVLMPFSGLNKLDPKVLAFAAARGDCVHRLIDSLIGGFGKYPLKSLVREYCENHSPSDFSEELIILEEKKVNFLIQSFEKWMTGKQFLPKPERFFDDEYMFTGEIDQLYKDHLGRTVLVDFKTSYQESPSWLLQAGAYSYLCKKAGINIEYIEFIQLSKTGGNPRIYHYQEEFALFKAHLDVYRYSFKNAKPCDILDYL